MTQIVKNIKKYRSKKNWSQETLSRRANISYNTLIKIEAGRIKNPGIKTVISIARALEVDIGKLII